MNNETNYTFKAVLTDWAGAEMTRRIEVSAMDLKDAVDGLLWKVANDFEGCELESAQVSTARSGWYKFSLVAV